MLKPRKQNKVALVKRQVNNTPYFGRYYYHGKTFLGPKKYIMGLDVTATIEDESVAFWPTGIGYIVLADEQGNPIKGKSENVKTA